MKILVTGSQGFIGKNLVLRLKELEIYEIMCFDRTKTPADLELFVSKADAIVHLAGVNRPKNQEEFIKGNTNLTVQLCQLVAASGRTIPLILSSSTQANLSNAYGESKRAAELACEELAVKKNNPITIFRLPGVFGKWCRPNYNSVVATFCHNIAYRLPIQINHAEAIIQLVYVDDVIEAFIQALQNSSMGLFYKEVLPIYCVSLGELAKQIEAFQNCRSSLSIGRVGAGFARALYATYVSYLPTDQFAYSLPMHSDERGVFVEMLKTIDSGQLSFFTAHPGVTRGGHYHHTKTEKFLVIKGQAKFGFRNMLTNERFFLETSSEIAQIVETIPGWTHDITNIGNEVMIVMLWANEVFDGNNPDTIKSQV